MRHVTLPGITPTVVILLIFAIGGMFSSGFEKIILLYKPLTYEVADVVATYVYRKGLEEAEFSFSTADKKGKTDTTEGTTQTADTPKDETWEPATISVFTWLSAEDAWVQRDKLNMHRQACF